MLKLQGAVCVVLLSFLFPACAEELMEERAATPKPPKKTFDGRKLKDKTVSASAINSETATADMVLKADGSGGAFFGVIGGAAAGGATGPAGGDLIGTYPNPTVAPGAITTLKIGDGQVTTIKLQDALISSAKIGDGQVTFAKLAPGVGVPHPTFTQMYTFANNGLAANTLTIPAGVTVVQIEGWGGGGGGGGGAGSGGAIPGGNGGSASPGLYVRQAVAVTPGSSLVITVGGKGSGGFGGISGPGASAGGPGSPGTASKVEVGGAVIFSATGGNSGGGGQLNAIPGSTGAAPTAGTSGVQLAKAGSVTVGNIDAPLSPGTHAQGGAGGSSASPGSIGTDGILIVSF